ncbi:Fic family protein [Staphylococcus pseudintermedius]|uniref:Fic family protein n=1 Tax=Staphylococcus pseudintermedius TaxID=283734 RepID=UPI001032CE6F|nr:Fic family protein [Staphylococcus pseudintermedius]EGQ1596257.1 Fic family protein [Staphylococcus pseudintermedius]EGQ2945503.1 Fic family protein [Staphylococcus pseudintermedius]EGQ3704319.1 Fic family protein [Staphylococcus pseudintermedius]EGQ4142866.1 Fic family protein [Staphylococcus pseudintermedius]EGQ4451601.1 Fic family protein [Staphylococcus pseudintermedius]
MTLQGIDFLPPQVTLENALDLYKSVAEINSLIGALNTQINHSLVSTQMIQLLTLSESVQSTRIEGTQVTFLDIIEETPNEQKSTEVTEVLNYKDALDYGVMQIKNGNPITTRLIHELHKILMGRNTRGTTVSSGEFRKIQNFIGPSSNIKDAVYIPVPAHEIDDYMTNWEHYINRVKHPSFNQVLKEGYTLLDEQFDPLIKTAIMHAQFESIHPYLDGNGRLGRILIVLNMMAESAVNAPIFFVSEELERERLRYYNLLNSVRGSHADWYKWIHFYLRACQRMILNLQTKLENIETLAKEGLKKINQAAGSKIMDVWFYTFTTPNVTVKYAAKSLNMSENTARMHLNTLVELGMIDVDHARKRNKVYVNYDLLQILR